MKIYYLANYDGKPNSGVTKKMLAQIKSLKLLNADVKLLLFHNSIDHTFDQESVEFLIVRTTPYKNLLDKIKADIDRVEALKKYNFKENDILYVRGLNPSFRFLSLIKAHKLIYIVEIVSNSIREARLRRAYIYYLKIIIMRVFIKRKLMGVVGITDELITKVIGKNDLPKIEIGNGFDVQSVPMKRKKSDNKSINLLCVANLSVWHGLDRLILGMKKYQGNDKIKLHIVGDGKELRNLQSLVKLYEMKEDILFYGFLEGERLNDIYDISDIGIANLGTHRKRINYTSSLKAREYCARGLPFVYSGIDKDFMKELSFVLKIPANESAINIPLIVNFYKQIQNYDYRMQMREYALEHLDWIIKMDKTLKFINEIRDDVCN